MTAKFWLGAFAVAMLLDLFLPYMLTPLYPGYSHRTQVMSVLGGSRSPVRRVYNTWLVLGGLVYLVGAWCFYGLYRPLASGLSLLLLLLLWAFALGGMILSGLFRVGEGKEMTTRGARIHGYGASLGFTALLFASLLLAIYYTRAAESRPALWCSLCFGLALVTFVLFVLAAKPAYAGRRIAQEGTWQRLTLLFMYLPLIYVSLSAFFG